MNKQEERKYEMLKQERLSQSCRQLIITKLSSFLHPVLLHFISVNIIASTVKLIFGEI